MKELGVRRVLLWLVLAGLPAMAHAQMLGMSLISTSVGGIVSGTYGYFKYVSATSFSAPTVSASTAIQVGSNSLTCDTGISGTMRYSAVSSTMEYCNGSAWTSMGPSATSPVSFQVNKGGLAQNATSGVGAIVTWGTEVFDTNNNFASNRFTPTVPGKYLLTASTLGTPASGNFWITEIRKNGTSIAQASAIAASGAGLSAPVAVVADANGTSDYFDVMVYQNSGATVAINTAAANTFFSGAMLAPQGSGGGGGATPAGSTNDIQYNSGGALAADTGNFTYASGLLSAPSVSATNISGTVATLNSLGTGNINASGVVTAAGISATSNLTSVTTLYASQYVSASTYYGDGSHLTGISAGAQGTVYGYELITNNQSAGGSGWFFANCSAGKNVLGGACYSNNGTDSTDTEMTSTSFGCYRNNTTVAWHVYAVCAYASSTAVVGGSTGSVQYNDGAGGLSGTTTFTYSNSLLSAPSVSATNISGTVATLNSLGTGNINASGVVTAAGVSATSNLTSVTTLYASGNIGIGTSTNSNYRLNIAAGTASYGIVVNSSVAGGVGVRSDLAASTGTSGYFTASSTGAAAVLGSDTGSGYYCYLGTGSYSLQCNGPTGGISDGRLKKDVVTLDSREGLAAIMQLRPVTYRWKDERKNHQGDPHYREMGFIAQDVEKVLPDLVGETAQPSATADPLVKGKIKALEYDRMVAPIVKAIQELKVLFDSDHAALEALKADNDKLRAEFEDYKRAHP
jgi:hypothetical protein